MSYYNGAAEQPWRQPCWGRGTHSRRRVQEVEAKRPHSLEIQGQRQAGRRPSMVTADLSREARQLRAAGFMEASFVQSFDQLFPYTVLADLLNCL